MRYGRYYSTGSRQAAVPAFQVQRDEDFSRTSFHRKGLAKTMGPVKALKRVVPRKLHRPLGVLRRWLRRVPPKVGLQKQRLLSDTSLSAMERELLREVSTRIHYNDGMYDGDGVHYFKVGLSAINCINEALEGAGLK